MPELKTLSERSEARGGNRDETLPLSMGYKLLAELPDERWVGHRSSWWTKGLPVTGLTDVR